MAAIVMPPETGSAPETARPRILLVDDEVEALRTLTALLSRDYDVTTSLNPLAAMQELSRQTFDAVVSDERMPGMTGTKFLGFVRRSYPDTVRIILTAYSDPDALLSAINEGEVDRFLLKPVQPPLLRQALSEMLGRRRMGLAERERTADLERRNAELEKELGDLQSALNRQRARKT